MSRRLSPLPQTSNGRHAHADLASTPITPWPTISPLSLAVGSLGQRESLRDYLYVDDMVSRDGVLNYAGPHRIFMFQAAADDR